MRKLGYAFIHLIQLTRFFGFNEGVKIFFKIILSKPTGTIEFNSNQFRNSIQIRKADSDIEIFYQVFCELQYDITFFLDFKPLNIIDCGSNVGYSCLYFANKFPAATIVGVEPETKNYHQLVFNTRNYNKVKLYNAAIWHKSGGVKLKKENEWSASFEIQDQADNSNVTLNGITLNQVVNENHFDEIDILKIDIEGAEYNLFANDPHSWLSKTKCLIIELHDNLKPGTSKVFFQEMSKYNWRTYIKGENIICFKEAF